MCFSCLCVLWSPKFSKVSLGRLISKWLPSMATTVKQYYFCLCLCVLLGWFSFSISLSCLAWIFPVWEPLYGSIPLTASLLTCLPVLLTPTELLVNSSTAAASFDLKRRGNRRTTECTHVCFAYTESTLALASSVPIDCNFVQTRERAHHPNCLLSTAALLLLLIIGYVSLHAHSHTCKDRLTHSLTRLQTCTVLLNVALSHSS